MKILFKNYWGTKVFILIQLETIDMYNSRGSRRVTYIGLLNFCFIIQHKPKYNETKQK